MSQLTPEELLTQLKLFTSKPPESISTDPDLRKKLFYAAQDFMLCCEDNPNPVPRVALTNMAEWITMQTCCQMGLYPALAAHDNRPKTFDYLAQSTKADAKLLTRFIRASVSFGSIKEAAAGEYVLSPSYAILGDSQFASALPVFNDFVHSTFIATPRLLRVNGYQDPTDPLNTAMQLAFDAPGKAPYEIFVSKPESAKAIGIIINAIGISPAQQISSVYPIHERLVAGFDASLSDAFFIDIGAGNAHVVKALRREMPDLPGRLVAQDLAPVIVNASDLPEGVEKQAYDFFTEQPIKEARAYYIRLCLHNWRDDAASSILARIHAAMKPGYSRLIIHEQVIQNNNPHPWATVCDLSQMGACASFQRTEEEWTDLLVRCGFQKPRFWYHEYDGAAAAAIESEVTYGSQVI